MNRSHVLTELQHFKPYDAAEAESLTQIIAFLKAQPEAFQRDLKIGHITGSALVAGFGGEKVLLMHHKALDRWLQFGGHADGDENILRVAMREASEESGIDNLTLYSDGIADVDVHAIPDRPSKNEPEHLHYDVRYILYTDEKEFTFGDKGVLNLKWCDFDEASGLVTDPHLRRLLQKWQLLKADRQPKLFSA